MGSVLLRFGSAEETIDVKLEPVRGAAGRYTATIDGREHEVSIDGEAGTLRLGGDVIPFSGARDGDTVHLWTRAGHERVEIVPKTARRTAHAGAAAATDRLVAPMPGTVLKINVAVGDTFEADSALVVMESMKMEMSLSVPKGGCVAEVCCAEGDMVDKDALLVRLEPDEEEAES